MSNQDKKWGTWGENVIFEFATSPVQGTFKQSQDYNFSQHLRLKKAPKLQANFAGLKTITFSLNLAQIVLLRVADNAVQRALKTTGISKYINVVGGESLLNSPDVEATIYTDINKFLNKIQDYTENLESQILFIGDRKIGRFVIVSIVESVKFHQNGTKKTSFIDLTFLEDK